MSDTTCELLWRNLIRDPSVARGRQRAQQLCIEWFQANLPWQELQKQEKTAFEAKNPAIKDLRGHLLACEAIIGHLLVTAAFKAYIKAIGYSHSYIGRGHVLRPKPSNIAGVGRDPVSLL